MMSSCIRPHRSNGVLHLRGCGSRRFSGAGPAADARRRLLRRPLRPLRRLELTPDGAEWPVAASVAASCVASLRWLR